MHSHNRHSNSTAQPRDLQITKHIRQDKIITIQPSAVKMVQCNMYTCKSIKDRSIKDPGIICHSFAFQTRVGGDVQAALRTGGLINSAGTTVHLLWRRAFMRGRDAMVLDDYMLTTMTFIYCHLQGNQNSSGLQCSGILTSISSRQCSTISGCPLPERNYSNKNSLQHHKP